MRVEIQPFERSAVLEEDGVIYGATWNYQPGVRAQDLRTKDGPYKKLADEFAQPLRGSL